MTLLVIDEKLSKSEIEFSVKLGWARLSKLLLIQFLSLQRWRWQNWYISSGRLLAATFEEATICGHTRTCASNETTKKIHGSN